MPIVTTAAPTCSALDVDAKLTGHGAPPAVLQQVADQGYGGVIRYVPLPDNNPGADIDATELQAILGAGLGLLLVQHVYGKPWNPANLDGAAVANTAVQYARAAGYPAGAHIFVDLEDIDGTAEATAVYANAWADAVVSAGYLAGCYVGFSVPLSPAGLYDLHRVNSYWAAPGAKAVATRGYAIKQRSGPTIATVSFDLDAIAPDLKGETPMWATSADFA